MGKKHYINRKIQSSGIYPVFETSIKKFKTFLLIMIYFRQFSKFSPHLNILFFPKKNLWLSVLVIKISYIVIFSHKLKTKLKYQFSISHWFFGCFQTYYVNNISEEWDISVKTHSVTSNIQKYEKIGVKTSRKIPRILKKLYIYLQRAQIISI